MVNEEITIINKLGLHARAAAKLVGVASRFQSSITIDKNGQTADAKSIMAVMMLAASQGTVIQVKVEGADEQEAWQAVSGLINNYFDEGE